MGRHGAVYPMSPLQEALVGIIRAELRKRHWQQKDLAAAAGYSPKHVGSMLNGRRQATLECWDNLLTAVGRDHYDKWRCP